MILRANKFESKLNKVSVVCNLNFTGTASYTKILDCKTKQYLHIKLHRSHNLMFNEDSDFTDIF